MTPERVEEIYADLVQLVVELDSNPASRGPVYMQELISMTRGYLNKVAYFMQEILREKHGLEDELAAYEAQFEIASNELMSNDARVTRLPAVDDRKAMINVILSDDRRKILELGVTIKNLGAIEKVIKHRQRELDRTMSEIRLQRSLIASELKTGSFYGSEMGGPPTEGTFGKAPARDEIDEDEIEKLMREADESLAEESVIVDAPEAEAEAEDSWPGTDDPEKIADGFLAASGSEEAPVEEEPVVEAQDDVEALLEATEDDQGLEDAEAPESPPEPAEAAAPEPVEEPTPEPVETAPEPAEKPAGNGAAKEASTEEEDPAVSRFLDDDDMSEEDLSDIFDQL